MALIANGILLVWFFLDMTGFKLGESILVTRAYREDGVFFLIFLVAIVLFWKQEKLGKYILSVWLFLWFFTQFVSHWVFTISGKGSEKSVFFAETIKLISSGERYIPDLYHLVLHVLILISIVFTLRCMLAKRAGEKSGASKI